MVVSCWNFLRCPRAGREPVRSLCSIYYTRNLSLCSVIIAPVQYTVKHPALRSLRLFIHVIFFASQTSSSVCIPIINLFFF